MAELWLLLGKEDLASWARRVPAGRGLPGAWAAADGRTWQAGTWQVGTGCSCLLPGTASPRGPARGSAELHRGLLNRGLGLTGLGDAPLTASHG